MVVKDALRYVFVDTGVLFVDLITIGLHKCGHRC